MNDMDEVLRIAATTVAMLEDKEFGQAETGDLTTVPVFNEITGERLKQDAEWGPQHHTAMEWGMILAVEIGYWAEQVLRIPDDTPDSKDTAKEVLNVFVVSGKVAQKWIDEHEWEPKRQSQFD